MAKNQNTTTATATERPDIEVFGGAREADVSSVLMRLWHHAQHHAQPALTESELAWLAGAGSEVSTGLSSITSLLTGVACLSSELEGGEFPTLDPVKASSILWPLINQLEALSSLAFISSEAAYRLARPSLYREGGRLHHR